MKHSIIAGMAKLTEPSLQALRSIAQSNLREAAVAELRSRGIAIAEDEGKPEIKQLVSKLAWSRANKILSGLSTPSQTEEERFERLNREGTDILRNSLDWFMADGACCYQLLVERGEIPRDLARNDISDRFQRFYDESFRRLEEKNGPEVAARVRLEWEGLQEFIEGKYTTAALAGLAKEPTTEDVETARLFLHNQNHRANALRIVAAKGTAQDVNTLIEIVHSSSGDDRKIALDGVQRLTDDKLGTARALLTSASREVRGRALSLIDGLDDPDTIQLLEELLAHDQEDLRIAAVVQLRKLLDNQRLEEILRKYSGRGSYFYDVVTWLDRLLYAPGPILRYLPARSIRSWQS